MAATSKIPSKTMQRRISKTGTVTQDDINEYTAQVGPDVLMSMGINESNIAEYLKNIVELGSSKKKKLPKKAKVSAGDSLVVADRNGEVATVPADQAAEDLSFKSVAKKTGKGMLDLGSSAFDKMFPTIGKMLTWTKSKLASLDKDAKNSNSATESYSRQAERSSSVLSNIAESQNRTTTILQQILNTVKQSSQPAATPSPATPPPSPTPSPAASAASRPMATAAATMAGGAAIAAGGAALAQQSSQPAATRAAPNASPSATAQSPVSRQSQETMIADFSLAKFREGDPEGAREYEEKLKDRVKELVEASIRATPQFQSSSPPTRALYMRGFEASAETRAMSELLPQYANRIVAAGAGSVRQQRSESATPAPPSAAAAIAPTQNQQATQVGASATSDTSAVSRLLNIRAKEIVFKADKFEFPANVFGQSGGFVEPSTPSGTPTPSAGTQSMGGSTQAPGAAPAGDLKFAPGVDPRINQAVATKVKQIESAAGKSLIVTSGYRDPQRNAAAGGAKNSAHMRANAVDVQFQGNEQDTINLIQNASAKGMGGIGVYRPGWLHLDTENKRVWGPDFTAKSIPQWAKPAMDAHMGAASAGGEHAEPTGGGSPSPAAAPAPAAPSSGAAVARASVSDAAASRPSAPPSTPSASSPGAPVTTPPQDPGSGAIDPNNPGLVEPADAAVRYARLFNLAA